ncbi:MAG: PfkB family carbohydrate kinase [candidate division Zixibacteria bacterium]|nr:PfkB family carbohydrate kinase [candidate division Zixibacteria bacterium]
MNRSKENSKLDCLGMGIMPLDFLISIPQFPVKGGKVDATNLCIQGGGPIPNAMVGLSRQGFRTAVIAVIGDDMTGQISLNELKKDKIDTSFIIQKKQPSATAFGFVENRSGRRTIALHRRITIQPRDLTLSRYPIPRILHLDGRDIGACLKLARWGKRVGALVTFDIGSIRNDVTSVLPFVDHLIVADAFAFPYTGTRSVKKSLQRLAKICPGTIVITRGTKGSVGFENGKLYRQKAFRVKAVDTTGAGDAFHVGYLYGLLEGKDISERLKLGSAVGALKCTQPGARAGMPTRRQLQRFLKNNPETYA